MLARCRPSRRAISLQLRPISIKPRKRHLSSSVRWLYLVPMATPDIAGVALGLGIYAVHISSMSSSSWLHPLKIWSLRETRRGSHHAVGGHRRRHVTVRSDID